MNKPLLHVLLSLLMCLTFSLAATAQVVDIPDPNLRAAIEGALGKGLGATITVDEMAGVIRLEARNANISDLTGLEHATNLTELLLRREYVQEVGRWINSSSVSDLSPLVGLTNLTVLWLEDTSISDISPVTGLTNLTRLWLGGNAITDISPVARLTNLTGLSLWGNNITDISPLAGLTNLIRLELGGNNITDISSVAGLTNLTGLWLEDTSISDISPLVGLTNLTRLELGGNNITDISPLAGLTDLTELRLQNNWISDILPLVTNTGLGSGDMVHVRGNRLSAQSLHTHIPALKSRGVTVEFDDTTHLNVGEPRTVRMIYFLPNDQPYRSAVVQQMKNKIRIAQTFFAEQMDPHGYGKLTFAVETDAHGAPIVHRVEGQYGDSHYHVDRFHAPALTEIEEMFNTYENVYVIIVGLSGEGTHGGVGYRRGKNGGAVLVPDDFGWQGLAHEMGHAFGLFHDFRDGAYLLSYGPGPYERLSACHAEYLSVHPYLNPDIPIEIGPPPTIELISPQHIYPVGSKSIPIQFRISDSDGLHQWLLHAWQPHVKGSVKVCGGVRGTQEIIINFDYDGVIPSAHNPSYGRNTSLLNPLAHPIRIEAVDVNGNVGNIEFALFSEAFQPLSKISGDNQRGVPNIPLAIPFVVELRNTNNGWGEPGVLVTFTVTAGGGTLNVTHTTTDTTPWKMGRAESTLTLGPHLGTNTVEVSAAGIEGTVTFTAVAGAAVDIPDPNLRAAIEEARGKAPGTPIAPSDMAKLTHLTARGANITNLTGFEFATNLTSLDLGYGNGETSHAVKDLSPLADLTQLTSLHLPGSSISDISAVAGLTNLTYLNLWGNPISDISPVVGLTNLTDLYLGGGNNISDISPLVANTGLGNGDTVYVRGNPLSYLSIHTHIPALRSRGVTVEFDADGTRPPDVNGDGSVNVLDLIAVTSYFGHTGENIATDVSGDGVVDVLDLVLVAGSFDGAAAAPSAQPQTPDTLTAVEVRGWLTDARALEVRDPIIKRGMMVLEQLLISLTPTETELLANYPNPFNPETWIPYRLAEDAFVRLTIYDGSGRIVRTFNVGHRIASAYENRSKAIYWDGRNNLGEQVASGVYFYTLTAGDYSATRRMVILK